MTAIRIVVLDASVARLYEFDSDPVGFRLVDELANGTLGRHERDLVSSRAGRRRNPASGQRQALAPVTDARAHALEVYARRIADWLDAAVRATDDARFVVVAAPKMLGLLRAALSPRVAALVVVTVPKDLAHAEPRVLERSLSLAMRRARLLGGNSGAEGG